MKHIKLFLPLLLTAFYLLLARNASADMTSGSYRIRMGNFNMTSGTKTGSVSGITLTDTVGQTAAGTFNQAGFTIKAGFQYIYSLYDFSFSISDLSIDLGTLTPGQFATADHTLTVTAPGQGYTVTAYENHPLQTRSGDPIPDTTCNAGSCTELTGSAAQWDQADKPGFGFTAAGNDVSADFASGTRFRQFANAATGELPQVLMSTVNAGKNRTATVTFKALIAATQTAGEYENSITYIATPVY